MALTVSSFYWASQITFLLVLAMLVYAGSAYNTVILDRVLPVLGHTWAVPALRLLFNVTWVLTIWSFLRARFSDPGVLPETWQAFVVSAGPALPIAPSKKEWQPRKATMCMKCRFPRPERAHHCLLCGCCVMRYDHHCPWISNCVGFLNHKFFLQLCMYAWTLGFLALLVAVPLAPACIHGVVAATSKVYQDFEPGPCSTKELDIYDAVAVLSLLLLGIFACMLLGTVLCTHLPLSLRNTTTVEDFYDNMTNPFDQGSKIRNLAQTFGAPGLDWVLPIRPWKPLSDGVTFSLAAESDGLGDASHREACDCLLEAPEAFGHAIGSTAGFGGGVQERDTELLFDDEPFASSRGFDGGTPSSRLTAVSSGCIGSSSEELWRMRYRLHQRLGRSNSSPTVSAVGSRQQEGDGPGSGPTLLNGLWSSFWRPRKPAGRRAVWL